MIKKYLKKLLSETQRQSLRRKQNRYFAIREFLYDANRFIKHSSAVYNPKSRGQLAAHITMDYHRLEKGLSLLQPRVGFGKDVIARLLWHLGIYVDCYGSDDLVNITHGVLRTYQEIQGELGFANDKLNDYLAGEVSANFRSRGECGVMSIEVAGLFPFETEDAELILSSRHSVRQFTGELVSDELVERIAALAQRAPSVCNRQGGRLYFANQRERIDWVLSFQSGNRGFGHLAGAVLVVAVDLQVFTTLGERNQGFVDGGIFAMETLAAIHAQKLGGCMLNWSVTSKQDRNLRKEFDISESEVIIAMIACGVVVENPSIAVSPRIDLETVLKRI